MKKLPLFLLGLASGAIPTAFAASAVFSDVSESAWYSDAVNSLSAKEIVEGYTDSTYRPSNEVNRAEMAVMIDGGINFNLAYSLAHAMVVWANDESTPQEVTIDGVRIIESAPNAGGNSEATIDEESLTTLAAMLEGQELEDISFCQEAFETGIYRVDLACDFLGEVELNDTEFGIE